jgi:hypothetical protein
MWDVLRNRVLRTDISDPDIRSFTGFAQCIVARIEVLSFLEERKRFRAGLLNKNVEDDEATHTLSLF